MRSLENENDPKILKELLKMAQAHIEKQNEFIKTALAEKAKIEQFKFSVEESFRILSKKYFGKSSEKSDIDRNHSRKDDNEIQLHCQNIIPPVKEKKVRDLAEVIQVHEATDDFLLQASKDYGLENPSADHWEKVVGLFDESIEIEVTERVYTKIRHKRQKYRLKNKRSILNSDESTKNNYEEKTEILITAPSPVKLLPGASYSINFAVTSVIDKYLNHIPLERQCRTMDSLGLYNMKPQILYNLIKVVGMYGEDIVDHIRKEILSEPLVHSDETPWPINNKKDSDGYMWILSNRLGSYYRFEPSRAGAVIKETLQDYSGAIMTDGYSGYYQFRKDNKKNINQNKLGLCHAHARRYFFEIKENYPEVEYILEKYRELFKIEKLAKDFSELLKLRKTKSQIIINEMKVWLLENLIMARNETKFKSAIEYSLNHWTELTVFLEDVFIPLTNNEAERTIRQAVMGRKNFYGSRSIDGADLAAILYTLIESCKKVEIDPRKYLLDTIKLAAAEKPTQTPFEYAKLYRQQPS